MMGIESDLLTCGWVKVVPRFARWLSQKYRTLSVPMSVAQNIELLTHTLIVVQQLLDKCCLTNVALQYNNLKFCTGTLYEIGAGAKQVGHYIKRGLRKFRPTLLNSSQFSYCKCYLSVKQSIQFANSDKYYCIVCEWFAPRRTQLLTNYLWLSKFL